MDKEYSRSEPRVLYRAPVWLRPSESGGSTVGETRNLSRRGMFVSVTPTPPLGTEVFCELPGRAAVRGRVAWVFNASSEARKDLTGVGIELVDLSETSPSLIEELVGVRLDDTQPVEIRFAGLPSPIRATGRVTHEGLDLSTTLAFLRVGSDVNVGAISEEPGARLHGRIARVGLRTEDGVPRLQISISIVPDPAPVALEPDDERWFPEIFVVQPDENSIAFEPTALVLKNGIPPQLAPVMDAPMSEALPELVEAEPTLRTETVPETPPLRPLARRSMHPPKRNLRGLVIAGCVVATGAFAGWLALPARPIVEEGKVEVTTVATTPDPVIALTAADPAPVAAADPVLAAVPVAAPVRAAALSPEHPVDAANVPSESAAPASAVGTGWRPLVTTVGGNAAITIPLTGAGKNLSTFVMSDPPGLAVDLPKGRTEVALKSYLFHDGAFRSLWVRSRPAGGLQIRLHVVPGVHVAVESVEGGIRFRRVTK